MAMDEKELGNLIGSDKVEGTAVYGSDERKIGSIERVMIDKKSGRVSYAVLGFGGILGLGNDHYPLPWQSLKYDTKLGGYVTGVTESQLRGAPKPRAAALRHCERQMVGPLHSAMILAAWALTPAQAPLPQQVPKPDPRYLPMLFIDDTLFESTHGGMSLRVQPPKRAPRAHSELQALDNARKLATSQP